VGWWENDVVGGGGGGSVGGVILQVWMKRVVEPRVIL